jgi:NAD(P)H-hydrate epimerase
MRTVTTSHMQAIDRRAINGIGIPSLCLMENAGRCVTDEVVKLLGRSRLKRVLIICGIGNNGGDGLVAARHLLNSGVKVSLLIAGSPAALKPDALINYKAAKKLKIPCHEAFRLCRKELSSHMARADVIVDAIFGVGLGRAVDGPYRELVEAINVSRRPVIAIDIPSGLDGTTGKVLGVCVKATSTITLAAAKKGLFINEGPHNSGKVIVADIGIPKVLFRGRA